jgi:hypothetical protein
MTLRKETIRSMIKNLLKNTDIEQVQRALSEVHEEEAEHPLSGTKKHRMIVSEKEILESLFEFHMEFE